jgi:hypothetical protein
MTFKRNGEIPVPKVCECPPEFCGCGGDLAQRVEERKAARRQWLDEGLVLSNKLHRAFFCDSPTVAQAEALVAIAKRRNELDKGATECYLMEHGGGRWRRQSVTSAAARGFK